MFLCILLVLSGAVTASNSARILGVFPQPSISHQVVFRRYYLELAARGHEVVVLTTDPALPKDRPKDNITEIDIGFVYEEKKAVADIEIKKNVGLIRTNKNIALDILGMLIKQFNSPQVKEIFDDKSQKFDLIVVESMYDYGLIVSEIFKAPVIQFSSYYGFTHNFDTVGAVSRHPVFHPFLVEGHVFDIKTLWERTAAVLSEFIIILVIKYIESVQNNLLKENYGPDTPTIYDMKNNVDMLFLNVHQMLDSNRAVPPNVIYLGGIHLQPRKPLPEGELKTYLDNSENGVIYVSFGTNVWLSAIDSEILDDLIKAFGSLPYNVLWKCDLDQVENLPKNIKISEWFPQRDMLFHPNIKAFVTQGGLQSTDEAIDAGVPFVGIPMIGDQYFTMRKYAQFGVAENIDIAKLTSEGLVEAIRRVAENPSYKANIVDLRSVLFDQPLTALERSVWWTEHVLRRGGARHLRSPAHSIGWAEFLMLDVAALLLTVLVVVGVVLVYVAVKMIRVLRRMFGSDVKMKVN